VKSKPSHWSAEIGEGFTDPGIAEAYPHRPDYPPDVIELLVRLGKGPPRAILDVGCGTGDLARRLAPHVDRVDAVDPSAAMLAIGLRLPGGDHPRLRWQCASAEAGSLSPPYAMVTAGESLHWMDWPIVFPRFADVLTAGGVLAIVDRIWDGPPALAERLGPIFARYSTVRHFRRVDLVTEVENRGLFTRLGERHCGPEPWRPTIQEYLEGRHSQRGFSRAHMDDRTVAEFDDAVGVAVEGLVQAGEIRRTDDRLELAVEARVVWGTPHRPD